MLIDTDVIIWYMRGNPRAARALERIDGFALSAVTYMELVQGIRNKRELQVLRATLRLWASPVVPIDESISHRAVTYIEQYFHSHSVRLADALIGATAVVHGMTLLTANTRHYRMIADLTTRRFSPG